MKKLFLLLNLLALTTLMTACQGDYGYYGRADVSPLVEQWREDVEFYADKYGISEYVELLLAIIAQESGGDADSTPDIMQCSASAGLTNNSITDPIASIHQGVRYFGQLLKNGTEKGVDMDTIIQSYNYGGGYTNFIAKRGGVHSESAAREFSKSMCDRYGYSIYGDVLYVEHVRSWLSTLGESDWGGDTGVEGIFEEMKIHIEKYQGVPYLFGGNGKYGIDCSGLTQKIYKAVGKTIPRTAQTQYDAVQHIPDSEAVPGDLVFFQGTYDTESYITHVGIYTGNNKMFHASSGKGYCCYASLSTEYFQTHFVGFGRP